MTRPSPTAAPSTSPPPRGEGMGVGGRPAKPRPGPEPGPPVTPRVTLPKEIPGQARDGVALCLAALFLTTQATAQIIPTGTPAADILLFQAIAEHRVFLTCNALDPIGHPVMVERWATDVAAAKAVLAANSVPPEAIAAFDDAARPEALLPTEDLAFAEVRRSCLAQADWPARYARGDFIRLEQRLPQAFP